MYHKQHDSIMIFDDSYFESILPRRKSNDKPLWRRGYNAGEIVYWIEIDDPLVEIWVRSSIDPVTNYAKAKSKDSIRVYLVKKGTTEFISVKAFAWTNRKPNWEQRLYNQLSIVREWRRKAGNCPVCHEPKSIFKVKDKEKDSFGRIFAKCIEHGRFVFID